VTIPVHSAGDMLMNLCDNSFLLWGGKILIQFAIIMFRTFLIVKMYRTPLRPPPSPGADTGGRGDMRPP